MERDIPKRRSVFLIVGIIFLGATIPLSVAAALLFSWQIRSMDEAMVSSFQNSITQNYNNLIKEMEHIDALCLEAVYDESAVMLSSGLPIMKDYDKTVLINRMFSRLKLLKGSSRYIKEVRMYFPEYGKVLTSDAELSPFLGSLSEVEGYHPEGRRSLYNVQDGRMYSGYLPAGSTPEDGKVRYLLVVEYEIAVIENELVGELTQQALFCLWNKDGEVIAEKDFFAAEVWGVGKESTGWQNVQGEKCWVVRLNAQIDDMTLTAMLPMDSLNPQIRVLRTLLIVYSAALICFMLLVVGALARFIRSPIRRLMKALKEVEQGDYEVHLTEKRRDEFGYLNRSFNRMAEQIQHLVNQVYQQKILNQEAELKQMQAWINPHFLYNSFFSISNMARLEDHDNIKQFAEYLGKYYQFVTKAGLQDVVTLEEEVEHSRAYVMIQKMRFGECLEIAFSELPQQFAKLRVPRLMLQPFVENAFQHGLSDTEEQVLNVSFVEEPEAGQLVIRIEDNGQIETKKITEMNQNLDTGEVTGIVNVHRRLNLYFGGEAGVRLGRSKLGGLLAEIVIGKGDSQDEGAGS